MEQRQQETETEIETEQCETEQQSCENRRRVGFVKWFNKKSGYGFIKVLGPEINHDDVFVHFSNLRGANIDGFRYLTKGEYIEFLLSPSTNPKHEFFATDVTGIYQGHLMCDFLVHHNNNNNNSTNSTNTFPTFLQNTSFEL